MEFVLKVREEGFIIVIQEEKVKYLAKQDTIVITDKLLKQNIDSDENKCLDKLILFESDEDGICEIINQYRNRGINARMYSVFREAGNRILDYDETDLYISRNIITA